MNKGDTVYIILDYTINDEPITEGRFDEIEFYLGENRYLLSEGDIVWDSTTEKYYVFVDQEDSFKLTPQTIYQLRVRSGTDVTSTGIKKLVIGDTISTEEI